MTLVTLLLQQDYAHPSGLWNEVPPAVTNFSKITTNCYDATIFIKTIKILVHFNQRILEQNLHGLKYL